MCKISSFTVVILCRLLQFKLQQTMVYESTTVMYYGSNCTISPGLICVNWEQQTTSDVSSVAHCSVLYGCTSMLIWCNPFYYIIRSIACEYKNISLNSSSCYIDQYVCIPSTWNVVIMCAKFTSPVRWSCIPSSVMQYRKLALFVTLKHSQSFTSAECCYISILCVYMWNIVHTMRYPVRVRTTRCTLWLHYTVFCVGADYTVFCVGA